MACALPVNARRDSARIAAVHAYVAVTDRDWYRALRDRPDLDGEPYYPLNGQAIIPPEDPADQPSRELLQWHADTKFRG